LRRFAYLVGVIPAILIFAAACGADGPPGSAEGKLFGFAAPRDAFAVPELAAAYEKSGATAAFLTVEWGKCEPNDPGSGAPKYDFSSFDNQPLAKSAKTRVCWIDLANPWAGKIGAGEPERYWKLAEGFVTEFVKHANPMGIEHFAVRIEQESPESSVGPTAKSIEPLQHVFKAAKAVSNDNTIIAEQPYGSGGNAIEILYRIGAKGSFDVAAVHAVAKAGGPVDPFALVAAHREMARNGEGNKKLLVLGGWEPTTALGDIPWQAMQGVIENDYRNILTDRDLYDPAWVLGEVISLPERPSADFVAAFPAEVPKTKLEAQLTADNPIFNYVTEKPYRLALTLTNLGKEEMKLGKFIFSLHGDRDAAIDVKPEGESPASVAAGGSAAANFSVAFPRESAGKEVTLVGALDYTIGDKPHTADTWLTLTPTPQYEITILPSRLILDPREGAKQVGMSVINHTDAPYDGKITLSAYPGITVRPTEFTTKIDPLGLEGFAFNVAADKGAAPGHYAVFVDVGGKAKDWQAVDVALVAKKAAAKPTIDGKLDDWKDAASFTITATVVKPSGAEHHPVGRGWIAYDDSALYLALEVTEPNYVKSPSAKDLPQGNILLVGFDPLINGARAAGGGYKEDDYEFELSATNKGLAVSRTQAPASTPLGSDKNVRFAFRDEGGKDYYEAAFPWAEIAPLKSAKGTTFAMALQAFAREGELPGIVEWGGGLSGPKDPRMFVPVIVAE